MAKKQTEIPGTERKVNRAIEEKAAILRKFRTSRLNAQKKELAAQADLLDVMQAEKVTRYVFEDDGEELEVLVADVTKVKVRKVSDDVDGDE
jgi:predicted Mrr-cat superfamily restriction endonuclease